MYVLLKVHWVQLDRTIETAWWELTVLNTAPLWHERRQRGWAWSRHETPTSFFVFPVVSLIQVVKEMRRMAGLCLADLRPIAGLLERQMREEEGMSKRCECQYLLEGWEDGGWKRIKLFCAGWKHDRDNLSHTCLVGSWVFECVLHLWQCRGSSFKSLLWWPFGQN